MGLCGGETAKKKKPKTIIIPKGVVDPNKNNILEIPAHLVDGNSNLIVKASDVPNAGLVVEPYDNQPNGSQINIENKEETPYQANAITKDCVAISEAKCASPSENPTSTTVSRQYVDFSSQTELSWEPSSKIQMPQNPVQVPQNPVQMSQNQIQSSRNIPQLQPSQKQTSAPCPICSQTSCKYSRPYNNLLNQISPKYTDFDRSYYSRMKSVKSEVIFRPELAPKQIDETALLNKLLDEKVDRILKPLLHSLARALPLDEEREIFTRSSYGSLEARYSRDRYPRQSYSPRSASDARTKSSYNRNRSEDYVDDDRSSMRNSPSPEPYDSKRRSVTLEDNLEVTLKNFQKCITPASCYRKPSVNFEDDLKK